MKPAASASAVIPPESEAHFQAFVVKLAKSLGWLVYHTKDSRRSEPGFPDLLMVRGDRVIAAELKRDGRSPTTAQRAWLKALGAAGVESCIWRPADKQTIASALSR